MEDPICTAGLTASITVSGDLDVVRQFIDPKEPGVRFAAEVLRLAEIEGDLRMENAGLLRAVQKLESKNYELQVQIEQMMTYTNLRMEDR